MRKLPRRGDVYWVALDPTVGSEIKKTRLAVIISNNSCNTFGSRVVVLPLTATSIHCIQVRPWWLLTANQLVYWATRSGPWINHVCVRESTH
ncbi:MAG: type II toxin-antitoxin system PemK/MazF family toxin [Nitrospira sp.]